MCPEQLVELADAQLLEKVNLPLHEMPELSVEAARQGQLRLLKWLAQQQPPCPLMSLVCRIAARRSDLDMARILVVDQRPAIFPQNAAGISPACFALLAQTGCPMRYSDRAKAASLVESWYVLMGLQ